MTIGEKSWDVNGNGSVIRDRGGPGIKGQNSVDFSADLRIIERKVQFPEGDFSGEWGAGQLPESSKIIPLKKTNGYNR